jgi:hypothetical protein
VPLEKIIKIGEFRVDLKIVQMAQTRRDVVGTPFVGKVRRDGIGVELDEAGPVYADKGPHEPQRTSNGRIDIPAADPRKFGRYLGDKPFKFSLAPKQPFRLFQSGDKLFYLFNVLMEFFE